MQYLKLTVEFIEPYRLVGWIDKAKRNHANQVWMRGQGFARWHKDVATGFGRPYITGTLLRSAVIKAIEEELARTNGKWNDIQCCQGQFYTENKDEKPKNLRHRSTIGWAGGEYVCQDKENACPLCVMLGRFDEAGKGSKDHNKFDVRFGNLSLPKEKRWKDIDKIGMQRTLNRVDDFTGKAHDWFKIYEIDSPDALIFNGVIEIGDNIPNREAVLTLFERALGFVDRLCGGMVKITTKRCEVDSNNHVQNHKNDNPQVNQNVAEDPVKQAVVNFIGKLPEDNNENRELYAKMRTIADAVRALRGKALPLDLPKGHVDRNGQPTLHFIWDKLKLNNGQTLREALEDKAKDLCDSKMWRRFCEGLGQALYERSKGELSAKQADIKDDAGLVVIPNEPTSYGKDSPRTGVTFTHEWIIVGTLMAETPFHVGLDVHEGDHTSMKVLLGRDNRFRLPRSVLRGVLRRDLGLITGRGCTVELGSERPCQCDVCQIMRNVTILDTKSDTDLPPDIRYRIKRYHTTGTVNEGSLFDSECGMEGMTFPFVLRFKGGDNLPKSLMKALTWWNDGKLFLGGNAGTGKGRFKLENIVKLKWDLSTNDNARQEYVKTTGHRGDEHILAELVTPTPTEITTGLTSVPFQPVEHEHPWRKISWSFFFEGPVLSADPITALCQDRSDNVFYKKTKIGKDTPILALKGEGLRGLVRNALGRVQESLLDKVHEDCDCHLCRLFGNEHHAGLVRFEDMESANGTEKIIDHVSIDRFDGGVVEKFDDKPLVPSNNKIEFHGFFWLSNELEKWIDTKNALIMAFQDIKQEMYPIGSRVGIGYGWISDSALNGKDLPEWFKLPPVTEQSDFDLPSVNSSLPSLPVFDHQEDAVYNPYCFLKIDDTSPVKRTLSPTPHTKFDNKLMTGKITCSIKLLSPLLLPDASQEIILNEENNHKFLPFFSFNNKPYIQGSQIRAAISSVFEALTNSCFRVMKQKNYLSWRMKTDGYKDYLPGRVGAGGKNITLMKAIRLPLYDDKYTEDPQISKEALKHNENNWLKMQWTDAQIKKCEKAIKITFEPDEYNKLKNGKLEALSSKIKDKVIQYIHEKEDNAIKKLANRTISEVAMDNKSFLKALPEADRSDVLLGRKPIHFVTKSLAQNQDENFMVAKLVAASVKGKKTGYLKITGPNNANLANIEDDDDNGYQAEWEDPLDFSFGLTGQHRLLPNTQNSRLFPRPSFTCVKDGKRFSVTKRCERIFEKIDTPSTYQISDKAREQYKDIAATYQDNAKHIAKAFQTRLPHIDKPFLMNELQEGDLVYFKLKEGIKYIDSIIPVCISRETDDKKIGERLPSNYRPCSTVCLEDCIKCNAKSCKLPIYREGAFSNGLCPACHLFGAGAYKSRVRFSFASIKTPKLKDIILPLQERPRPTWVLPVSSKGNNAAKIPGRKFYLRHQGWKQIMEKEPKTPSGALISQGENNITTEALQKDTECTFDIHFENLEQWELGLLIYCLQLENGMAHMLGRGKPFGFGQCTIKIDAMRIRKAANKWGVLSDDNIEALRRIGLAKLPELWGAKDISAISQIAALRLALKVQPSSLKAYYPELDSSQNDQNKLPSYIELSESTNYDPAKAFCIAIKNNTPSLTPFPAHNQL